MAPRLLLWGSSAGSSNGITRGSRKSHHQPHKSRRTQKLEEETKKKTGMMSKASVGAVFLLWTQPLG